MNETLNESANVARHGGPKKTEDGPESSLITKSKKMKQGNCSLLKNWENLSERRDTLHRKACPVNVCSSNQCKGSIMNPKHMMVDPRTWNRSIEETKRLARDFIDQYFESIKRLNTSSHFDRLNEVEALITETGTYSLTKPELIFGAKTAWRNAPRCIGRIQWNKLHVFDRRHVTSTREMFEAICEHLEFATNEGNIRSCITFFPPRTDVRTEFRVWNGELIRYAGYRKSDGSVLGDPVNIEFTQICERLGWKGKGSAFDVLPLVLQANGEDPDLYEIPSNLVLEVKIRHPDYKWMEEMGLKWYAVPAVSGMLVDIGGIQFPGCPFNGWFMGTEIGRDLCDTTRYNLLEPIALKMGMNTSNSSSLWKDKALLAVNIAILHSFQTDRITIMDHHVATESFMKHFENEMKLRNGCPGDWVWLVPPISGSATPIFHQEILNYILNPTYFNQPDPWRYYVFKKQVNCGRHKQKKIKFKNVARSIMLVLSMMRKAMSRRIQATILYATETGKSQFFAEQLKLVFNFAFNAKVVAMNEYDTRRLRNESLVLVVTSTFGNGDPPENGENFANELHKMSQNNGLLIKRKKFGSFVNKISLCNPKSHIKRIREEVMEVGPHQLLSNTKFSVFGLGSTAYPNFCAFAHAVDTLLGQMGGERLLEIGEGNELDGQEDSFRKWAKSVFKSACVTFCLEENVETEGNPAYLEPRPFQASDYRISIKKEDSMSCEVEDYKKLHRKQVEKCRLLERIDLHPRQDLRATILVKLQMKNSDGLKFQPGDHLGVFPCNDPRLVKELLKQVRNAPPNKSFIQLEFLQNQKDDTNYWIPDPRLPVCSLWTAFSRYLDITTPPSPQLLGLFSKQAMNAEDKAKLETLSKGGAEYDEWRFYKTPNIVEVLAEFPSIRIDCSLLLSQLPLLQCRYYSISSSPDVHPGEVHCTLSVVTFRSRGGKGPVHRGVCSTYLDNLGKSEDVFCFIRRASGFHLPKKPTTPCILVGPGTGIAPYRSFWQQIIHDNPKGYPETMVLLFGCRHPSDHIYKAEVEDAEARGAISHYYTAYSRLRKSPKVYVQHLMEQKISDLIYSVLCERMGHFYVCGDVKMANDVEEALARIIAKLGKITKTKAKERINELKTNGRYHEDLFGATFHMKEVEEASGQKGKGEPTLNELVTNNSNTLVKTKL